MVDSTDLDGPDDGGDEVRAVLSRIFELRDESIASCPTETLLNMRFVAQGLATRIGRELAARDQEVTRA